jgi:ATP-dependent Lhr-like helicase
VVEQLQGFEAAVASWERDVLAARVIGYRPEWLDALCFSGQVVWGRLSPGQSSARSASISRATPVTLAFRSDLGWLQLAARGRAALDLPELAPATQRLLECLTRRGALFASELEGELALPRRELDEALWDAVARGLIASDGFGALRSLLRPRAEATPPRGWQRLRQGASHDLRREGRWAHLPAPAELDPDAVAEAVAEQLLARWGVVFADVLARENLALPYRELNWALRRLEARGVVRGGRFVNGFVGEQYARRAPPRAEWRTSHPLRLRSAEPRRHHFARSAHRGTPR